VAILGNKTIGERWLAAFPSVWQWEAERVREKEEQRAGSESCFLN